MEIIKRKLQNLKPFTSQNTDILFHKLKADGLGNVKPHDYQLYGIQWITHCWAHQELMKGVILGDEMGLGKTLQVSNYTLIMYYDAVTACKAAAAFNFCI